MEIAPKATGVRLLKMERKGGHGSIYVNPYKISAITSDREGATFISTSDGPFFVEGSLDKVASQVMGIGYTEPKVKS